MRKALDEVLFPYHPSFIFNLIAGTSTGALIAFGLAHGKSLKPMEVEEIIEMYKTETRLIFQRDEEDFPKGLKAKGVAWLYKKMLRRSPVPYSQKGLEEVLKQRFGKKTNLKSFNSSRCGAAAVARQFNEDPSQPDKLEIFDTIDPTISHSVVEVLLASTCAPVYFDGPTKLNGKNYIDGGVGGNCPLSLAIPRMQEIYPDRKLGIVLSLAPPSRKVRRQLETVDKYKQFLYWVKYFPDKLADGYASYEASKSNNREGRFVRITPKSPEAQKFKLDELDVTKMIQTIRDESTNNDLEYFDEILCPAAMFALEMERERPMEEPNLKLLLDAAKLVGLTEGVNDGAVYLLETLLEHVRKVEQGGWCVLDDNGEPDYTYDEKVKQRYRVWKAKTLTQLADAYYTNENSYAKAIEYSKQAIEAHEEIHGNGANHEDILDSVATIASCCLEKGDYSEAVEWYQKGLKMARAIHGEEANHEIISKCLNDQGICYRHLEKYEEAVTCLLQSMEMDRALNGGDSETVDYAGGPINLAAVYLLMEKHDEAVSMNKQALSIFRKVHGESANHSDTAAALTNIGACYQEMGEHKRAFKYYDESLKMNRAVNVDGDHDPEVASSLFNLGMCYGELEKHDKAVKMLEAALLMRRALYGNDIGHPLVEQAMTWLAFHYVKAENVQGAIKLNKEMLGLYEELHEPEHEDIVLTKQKLEGLIKWQKLRDPAYEDSDEEEVDEDEETVDNNNSDCE